MLHNQAHDQIERRGIFHESQVNGLVAGFDLFQATEGGLEFRQRFRQFLFGKASSQGRANGGSSIIDIVYTGQGNLDLQFAEPLVYLVRQFLGILVLFGEGIVFGLRHCIGSFIRRR